MPEAGHNLLKETPADEFPCLLCEIFKNTYFEQHLRTTAFEMSQI